jgi:hypothetical protein
MFVLVLLLGCQNACQNLCQTMAEQAAECDLNVSQDELESCITANEEPTEERVAQCLDADDPERLAEWWTCAELAENYGNGGSEGS